MKKFLQLLFCSLTLVLGLSSNVFAANFIDVPSNAWYTPYVNDLVERGIVNGVTDKTFAPDATVTRAEFVKILACTSGENLSAYNYNSQFTDCNTHWAKPYINWATDKEIVNGISKTKYEPNGNITREQMATMICRYLFYKSIILEPTQGRIIFTDNDSISGYAAPSVSMMQQVGIISGERCGSGYAFKPSENALRSASAKMVSCLIANIGIYNKDQYQERYQILYNNYNIDMTILKSELTQLQAEYTNVNQSILDAQTELSELPETMQTFLSERIAFYLQNHIYSNSYQAALAAKNEWDRYYAPQIASLNNTISANQAKLTRISSDISIKDQEITELTNQYNNDVANLKNKYNIE